MNDGGVNGRFELGEAIARVMSKPEFFAMCGKVKAMQAAGVPLDMDERLRAAGERVGLPPHFIASAINKGGDPRQRDEPPKPEPNGRDPEAVELLPTVRASSFASRKPPPREFLDERQFFPMRHVTLLTGDGGIGKSLLALQSSMAVALENGEWLGRSIRHGAALYVCCEDELEEMHRRVDEIAVADGLDLGGLQELHLVSLAGKTNVEIAVEEKGLIKPMPMFERLRATVASIPNLRQLVLDNLADLYAGNESARHLARQYVGLLRSIAIEADCSVLLLAHPSLSGMNSGTGTSGSTAWNNSVRSRLYLRRPDSEDGEKQNPNARVLERMKANYAPTGDLVNLQWDMGRLTCIDKPERAGSDIGRADKAERVFLLLLRMNTERGVNVSANPKANNYAPRVFMTNDERDGLSPKALASAMNSLFNKGAIRAAQYGSPSGRMYRLEVV
ncbi:AAA family ATPase [Ensifer sp. ENS07]|uniref:AAA family ATPase n=1 Tax=Ensifer sp. ENS07 TaxID=2769274 RepID=UPI00177E3AE6|nr:AAA family ATPase [Ensifer sp. ENS07]MBD9635995.1 AAA family ATPase [Ensifer sp. ENS07]